MPYAISTATLIADLANADSRVRVQALRALKRRYREGLQAFTEITQLTSDSSAAVRKVATQALGAFGDRRAFPYLAQALQDRAPNVRQAAVQALGGFCDQRGLPYLAQALQDRAGYVRQAAVQAIVLYAQWTNRQDILCLLPALHDTSDKIRLEALTCLDKFLRQQAMSYLVPALHDTSWEVRNFSLKRLKYYLGEANIAPYLLDLLEHPDQDIRLEAATYLGNLVGQYACIALLQQGRGDVPDQESAHVLAQFQDPQTVKRVLAAFDDTSRSVRDRALRIISSLRNDSHTIPSLISFLKDTDEQICQAAITALERLGVQSAIEPLEELLIHPCHDVQVRARDALQTLRAQA